MMLGYFKNVECENIDVTKIFHLKEENYFDF
jgi:hypothetical protein